MTERAPPLVIAHRGASGERPEHTISAYELAIAQGARAIEPDIVFTKDGVAICRHENELSGTTDIASRPEFAALRTAKQIDGREIGGWFAEDVTLAEVKTLRARERLPDLRPQSAAYDGQFEIATFAELVVLARQHDVALYVELKHATLFREQGFDPVRIVMETLRQQNWPSSDSKLLLQCFEVWPLEQAAAQGLACVQLMTAKGAPLDRPRLSYADMITDKGLRDVARYARAIGVQKSMLLPRDEGARSLPATDLCVRAHRAGLRVSAWTFRAENCFLPVELRRGDPASPDFPRQHGDLAAELRAAAAAGADGVFCDFPRLAVEAVR